MATMATKGLASFVTGRFVTKGSYVFLDEEGNVFFSIKTGDTFETQGKTWTVEEVPDRKNPEKTVLRCVSNTNAIYLTNNKFGYWDWDSDHPFISPRNPIEALFMRKGIMKPILYKRSDEPLYAYVTVGGKVKQGKKVSDMFYVITDGDIVETKKEFPLNTVKIENASYIFEMVRDQNGNSYPVKATVKYAENYSNVVEALDMYI